MAILRPTWQDIITEHNVQTWQDWPWDTWLGPYVVIAPRRYRVRVRVYRAGEWVDITSRVASGVNGTKIVYTKVTEEVREIDPQLLEVEIANLKVQRAPLLRQVEEIEQEIEELQAAAGDQT